VKTVVLILVIALLVTSNLYTFIYFNGLNGYLKFTLQQMAMRRNQVLGEYNILNKYVYTLNESYIDITEANERLREVYRSLQENLSSITYNYTLMNYFDFMGKFTFAYTDEMRDFVINVTEGWNGTDEDFQSDLYKIYKAWQGIFKYVTPTLGEQQVSQSSEKFLFINIGAFNYGRTYVYSLEEHNWIALDYLREVHSYEIRPIDVSGAPNSFRNKQGVCWDFAVVLVALYYAYYDVSGKSLPTAYISIRIIRGFQESHGVVFVKLEGDKVAILDWDVVTPVKNGMLEFIPFEEAKKLHEEYWGHSISYKGFMKGRPYEARRFYSDEEFYEWLVNELK